MSSRTATPIHPPASHYTLKTPLNGPFDGYEIGIFGMGCFWGAERKFFQAPNVYSTSVGYCGGFPGFEHPTYREVCSGNTGHAEVVQVVFDPKKTSYKEMLHIFWKNHNPTQLNRQGNDRGTQYRTCIFYTTEQQKILAEKSKEAFSKVLEKAGKGSIVTEIKPAADNPYYFAEEYHQQYLAKNPAGYCGLGGTGCYDPDAIDNELAPLVKSANI